MRWSGGRQVVEGGRSREGEGRKAGVESLQAGPVLDCRVLGMQVVGMEEVHWRLCENSSSLPVHSRKMGLPEP